MADLTVKWAGLTLKSPIIVGSCNLTTDPIKVKEMEQAGVGTVVFKSLFEEQIQLESLQLENELSQYNERHSEMVKIFPNLDHAGPEEHLHKISQVRKLVNIPLIASLNALHREMWIEWARKLQDVGADALELNFYYIPRDFNVDGATVERQQIELLKDVKKVVSIPVLVKLSPYYSNILNVVQKFTEAGADGVILFNRLFQPDIDIEEQRNIYPYNLSTSGDQKLALRFTALIHGKLNTSLTSATGIHTWQDAVKMLLAGADAFQIVSTLYRNGIQQITEINNGILRWMEINEFKTIDEFRGKLSQKNQKDPYAYLRAQYIDILMSSGDIFKQNMPI
ncbi:MAG TPA: dihydroorotate dehydrogenase-like protein [Salinivirgaceae bacterium]|nr:dihydroorotate dehydrogenase-like protein [Salinivirgaceae bacterium]